MDSDLDNVSRVSVCHSGKEKKIVKGHTPYNLNTTWTYLGKYPIAKHFFGSCCLTCMSHMTSQGASATLQMDSQDTQNSLFFNSYQLTILSWASDLVF